MRTESRFEQYDLNLKLPDPLLPRNRRYVVAERMEATGRVLIPLDRAEVETLADELKQAGYDSIAVGLLHSYVNNAHEKLIREVLAERLPGVMVSISSEVSPQMREYERFNTTIANAYIKPLMKSYLGRLKERLASEGADCPVFMMHSGGGIMSLESAAEFPVRLVESGPAGGAIFAADIAARHGLEKVLSFDMGGTTAKICLIRNYTPKTARVFEVARTYRFKKGSGMPISIPVIDMVEIGAGGGSLAHVDVMNQIRVGPESAGSEPGPACYGRGGERPAVTDADLVLGKLDPDNFAGGSIKLFADRSGAALDAHIGGHLDMDRTEAAWGLAEVVDENMANAARVHAVENGEDLSEYTMIAFGGAAPLHAARLCEKLGIDRCLVPVGAGVGSAIGFLRAPFSFEANRSVFMKISQFDAGAVQALFAELHGTGSPLLRALLRRAGRHPERTQGLHALQGPGLGNSCPADRRTGRKPGCGDIPQAVRDRLCPPVRPLGGGAWKPRSPCGRSTPSPARLKYTGWLRPSRASPPRPVPAVRCSTPPSEKLLAPASSSVRASQPAPPWTALPL
jgi:N-methylhydantoinase A